MMAIAVQKQDEIRQMIATTIDEMMDELLDRAERFVFISNYYYLF